QRAADQSPSASGDPIDAVDQEHRDQRPDLSQDVDGLLGIERIMPFPPGECLDCHASSDQAALFAMATPPFPWSFLTQCDCARKLPGVEGGQVLDTLTNAYSMHGEAELC